MRKNYGIKIQKRLPIQFDDGTFTVDTETCIVTYTYYDCIFDEDINGFTWLDGMEFYTLANITAGTTMTKEME